MSEFQAMRFEQRKGLPVEASVKQLAMVSSREDLHGHKKDRWTELSVYETKAGSFICTIDGLSSRPGEETRRKLEIVDSIEQVVLHMGDGWLAMELYLAMNLDAVTKVD